MDSTRRTLLTTGAAAVAAATAPRAFAQATGKGTAGETGKIYQRGDVRIHYQDVGAGYPLLIIPGGGHNSTIAWAAKSAPFNATEELKSEYRCITADLRNAPSGQSTGPLEIDRPLDSYTDYHLGLMDHLGIKRFMVLGFCIGGPFIWNLVKRKELPTLTYDSNMKGWGPEIVKRRPDISMEMIDRYLTRMYRGAAADFFYTVSRDVVRSCQSPVLIMPDDSEAHPYVIAMESAMLAPKSEVSMYPWKDTKDKTPLAVRQVRTFLRAHRPATA